MVKTYFPLEFPIWSFAFDLWGKELSGAKIPIPLEDLGAADSFCSSFEDPAGRGLLGREAWPRCIPCTRAKDPKLKVSLANADGWPV